MREQFTSEELTTIRSYDKVASAWVAAHSGVNYWADELAIFQRYLPAGYVLEIGAGGGRDAELLDGAGYDYVGIDISGGLLEQARIRNPKLPFLEASIYDIKSSILFDGFWCSATLLHLPKSRVEEALLSIHGAIRPKGVGFITIKEGYGDMIPEKETIDGIEIVRHFSCYQEEEFGDHLKATGYKTLEMQRREDSPKTTWLIYFVQVQK